MTQTEPSAESYAIGVDIGGTHITCAAVELVAGRLLPDTLVRATFDHEAAAGPILERWAAALNGALSRIDPARLAGIGFAIPGPFEYRTGISRMQHKFRKLYGIHIPTALGPLLEAGNALPMRFLNDATAFAVGEAWLGEGRGAQRVVVITLGTGFGSAFVEHGVPVVDRPDVPSEGCLWHLPFHDDIADAYFSTGWFVREYAKYSGATIAGVKELMEQAGTDALARQLFAQFGCNLAECLAPWLRSFGAGVLIIGGNISHALPLFEGEFRKGLLQAGVSVKVALSALHEHAALIGGARLLDDVFWEKVSVRLPHI